MKMALGVLKKWVFFLFLNTEYCINILLKK